MQVKFKPGAKRVELAIPLDTHGHNFNSRADASKQLDGLVLKSQVVDLPTSFAVGCLRGNTLMLSPLNEAVQMRPQLGHLDTAKKQVKEEEDADVEDKKPSFVTVSIDRRRSFVITIMSYWRLQGLSLQKFAAQNACAVERHLPTDYTGCTGSSAASRDRASSRAAAF